jgi:hypothetical protein
MSDNNSETTNPHIKYAELTVIKDLTNRSMWSSLGIYLGAVDEELIIDKENDKLIMMFEDDEILFDVREKYVDINYEFVTRSIEDVLYSKYHWIEKPNGDVIFPKNPKEKNNIYTLSFDELVDNHSKHKNIKGESSCFNVILYCHTGFESPNIFWIYRLISSCSKPRYLIGYHDEHFTKNDVIYMVKQIMLTPYIPYKYQK